MEMYGSDMTDDDVMEEIVVTGLTMVEYAMKMTVHGYKSF